MGFPAFAVGLALAAAASTCAFADDSPKKCRIKRVGSVPVEWQRGRLLADGSIDGTGARMQIDSGGQYAALTRRGAERSNVALSHTDSRLYGVGGESMAYLATVQDLKVAGLPLHHGRMDVIWDDRVGMAGLDALIGASLLFQWDVELSPDDHRLNLFVPQDCDDDAPLAYWSEEVPSVPMHMASNSDRRQLVPVEIGGRRWIALIDSGAARSLMNLEAACSIGFDPAKPGIEKGEVVGVGTHVEPSWIMKVDALTIGPERIANFSFSVEDMWSAAVADAHIFGLSGWINRQPDVILGADFLQMHRVLFAVSQQRFYFSYLGPEDDKREERP